MFLKLLSWTSAPNKHPSAAKNRSIKITKHTCHEYDSLKLPTKNYVRDFF